MFLWAGQQASNHCLHSCRKKVGGETHDSVDCAARVLVIVLLCGSFSQHSSFVLQAVHKMKAAWAGVGSQIDQWIRRQFYINGKQFNATISPQITTLNDSMTTSHFNTLQSTRLLCHSTSKISMMQHRNRRTSALDMTQDKHPRSELNCNHISPWHCHTWKRHIAHHTIAF